MARRRRNARTYEELMENSPAQEAFLEFLRDYKTNPDADGNNPTFDEIAKGLSICTPSAYALALKLVDKGILRWGLNRKLILGGKYLPPDFPDSD